MGSTTGPPAVDEAALARLLGATPLGLGDEANARLASLFRSRSVAANQIVIREGHEGGRLAVVHGGHLRAFRLLASGREITVFHLKPGDFFGFLPLLDGGPYPLSVAAMTDSRLLVLERRDFLAFLASNPDFASHLLCHLAQRLRGCLAQIELLGLPGAVERAASSLLSLCEGPVGAVDAEVALPFTQAELARTIHVTPENLSRALARLGRQGLIRRVGPRRFVIPSPEALERVAEGD